MITFANKFQISANRDGTVRIEFSVADQPPATTTAIVYMPISDAAALQAALKEIIDKIMDQIKQGSTVN